METYGTTFLKELQNHFSKEQFCQIQDALNFATTHHGIQERNSGEPYITHPIEVARILFSIHSDSDTICAGLLHDVIEDCNVSEEELKQKFNPRIAYLVDYVSKWVGKEYPKEERDSLNLNLLFEGFTIDVRVCLIKLADRLHNMRTLQYMRPEKQVEIAKETLSIFVPVANLLGLHEIKRELEKLCFHYMFPKDEQILEEHRLRIFDAYHLELKQICRNIKMVMQEHQTDGMVTYRIKDADRIYKRIVQGYKESDIFDLILFRVIVPNTVDCKQVSDLFRDTFPVEQHFIRKNYLDRGKNNLYQALKQTMPSIHGICSQVSIQTEEMKALGDMGIAYYWDDPDINMNDKFQHKILAPHLMRKMARDMNSTEYVKSVIEEILCSEKIYINTPKGDVIELPEGATICDFAYRIHSKILMNLIGATVNGTFVNLNYRLNHGDTVELFENPYLDQPNNLAQWCKTKSAASVIKRK